MKAIQYFNDHDSKAAITLPQSVSSVGIEPILKQCYYKSLLRKYPSVSFDFGQVTWCDVFAVSLFSLWIWELAQRGKKITVFLPLSADARRFFDAYDFRGFLNKQGVLLAGSYIDPSPPRSRELFVAPFYPLTFVTASAFQELIKDLHSGNRLEAVLAQVKAADVVKSGAIRDVILKELGDNMFLHAGGTAAHFIMTKMPLLYPSRPLKWRRTTKRRLADVEASFIRKLGREPALEVVISDKGDGIFPTLKQAYKDDAALVKKSHPPTECEVIEYAFAYHSSRRTVEERVGLIKQVISSESFSIPPPTGLHRLKEIVRENHGLLYVRSGSSIICYDFYQNQEHDTPVWSDDLSDGKDLANFGGTQYRLLLPVQKPEDTKGRRYFASDFIEDLFAKTSEDLFAKTPVEHIALKDHFATGAAVTLDEEATMLDTFFRDIDGKRATKKDQRLVLFANFSSAHRISAKVLHYLVCELIQRQETLQTNIITYMPREMIADCRHLPVSFTRKLIAFDEAFTPHLIGATPSEDSAFQEILGSNNPLSGVASDFARSNGHLFHYAEWHSRYFLSFPGSRTAQLTNTAIKQQLATDILEPTHGIFDPDIKVLLLSEAYCRGYFETYKILSNSGMKEELIKSFACSLIECRPDIVVSIGEQTREVMDATLSKNMFLRDQNIQHLNVQTGRSGHLRFANILGLDRTARVVVVTDVIGTSHTLESTLAIILHADILKVLAIVNASTQWDKTIELKGQEIPVDYIVRRRLSYFDHLPRGWSYNDIHQVDPDTHILVRTAASTEGALWKDKERVAVEHTAQEDADYPVNRFFTDVVFPASAFSVGHFVSARKHILYLFDVHRIAGHFSDEIVRTIENDVKRVIESRKADRGVAHIVYRDVNPGLELIADKSCGRFPGATLTSISDDEFRSRFDQETALWSHGIVVLLDDAADSGDTLFRLLDMAERAGATCVLGYVLIKRGTQYVARRLEKTRQYGRTEVQIRFLAEAEIPSYSDDNCPVCQEIRELLDLLRQFPSTPRLSQALRSKIDALRVTPVSIITHEQTTRLPEQHTTLDQYRLLYRWHLEMAKEDPAARHSLAKVVRGHQDERQRTVAFFSLLAAERIPSRLEHPWFTTIFYATFQEEIVQACRDLIACYHELSEDALAATLYVSEVFDPDSAMTNCTMLLEHIPVDSQYFLEVVIHSLGSKVLNDYPAILKSLFQALRLRAEENADVDSSRLLHDLAQFWTESESNVDTDMRKRLRCYQELRGGRFHEIGHLRDSIVFCAETDPIDFDGLLRDWNVLRDEVGDIVGLVRECIATHVTSSTARALEEIIHRITLQTTDRTASAEPAESDSGEGLDASERERISVAIAQSAQRIHDLIHADGGLRTCLDRFQANVKSITYQILQQHGPDLQTAGVKVERRFPEEACVVFAEDPHLKLAIHNIIENVWKSSEARHLEIGADIKPNREYIEITFADDGKGFNGKTGTGLKNVERIVRSYGGSFSIRQIDDADSFFSCGFRTVASMILPFLP